MTIEFEAFAPGEFIKDELDERGWSQTDLAAIMGRSVAVVNQIINAKTEVTLKTAEELGAAFGTSAEFWLNLESAYKLARSEADNSHVSRRAKLFEVAPVSELTKRNWIRKSNDVDELEASVLRFMGMKSIDDTPILSAAARKSDYSETTPAQMAWLMRVRQIAEDMPCEKFTMSKLEKHLEELHGLTTSVEEVRRVPEILSRMGIRFVVVQHLPQTKIDGCVIWLSKSKPVIAVSMRYDRIDGFWFTLAHELSHVRHEDNAPIDVGIVGEANAPTDEIEIRANVEASEWLMDKEKLESFIVRTQPRFSKTRIIQFANLHKVHPGVIVGQLQHRGLIEFRHSREMLVQIRKHLIETSVTDGWGHLPGIGV